MMSASLKNLLVFRLNRNHSLTRVEQFHLRCYKRKLAQRLVVRAGTVTPDETRTNGTGEQNSPVICQQPDGLQPVTMEPCRLKAVGVVTEKHPRWQHLANTTGVA